MKLHTMTVGGVPLAPNIQLLRIRKRKRKALIIQNYRRKSVKISQYASPCYDAAYNMFIACFGCVCYKTVGGDFYTAARQWYYGELNKSIIAENTPDDYNLSEIFGTATDDEV